MYTILFMSMQAIRVTYQPVKVFCYKKEVESLLKVNISNVNQ